MKNNKPLILLLLATIFLIASCSEDLEPKTKKEVITKEVESTENNTSAIIKDISPEAFKRKIANGNRQLIDVRTPAEYSNGTIEDAINLDFNGGVFENEYENLDPNQTVLIFCASGGRSTKAKMLLKERGFQEVYNLIGGYNNWPH
ncbi:rhodanese-like domain-containing protein [Putridiphycobacter roseus]|uniref:Rhodanese-like domain-containing protein n=1 Tax=Putridiphycobacter roseus TaxID=2219161 RepID=A0A2W1N1F2_9FLAO|nr:rhodanese-like domain-containing protein [Putridiphycobacter roseus]PZE17380.1 rhodanese-like domain-containing protein [Putridiphycobacter roseus]